MNYLGPFTVINKIIEALPRTDLHLLGITNNVLQIIIGAIPWNSMSLRPDSVASYMNRSRNNNLRKINLSSLMGVRGAPHILLQVMFVVFQSVCMNIRSLGGRGGLPGAVLYPLFKCIIVLCASGVSSMQVAKMLGKNFDVRNFDFWWLVSVTSASVKSIPGMIKVPLHRSLNKNLFVGFGSKKVIDGIIGKNRSKSFAYGQLRSDDSDLLLEVIALCAALSPILHGVGDFNNFQLVGLYINVGQYVSRLFGDLDLELESFFDFAALFELLKNVCKSLGLGEMFAESLVHFIPANVVDLATLINVLESLRAGVIYWFIFAGDYYEYYGNKLVLKYYHSDLRVFDEIWVWRKW